MTEVEAKRQCDQDWGDPSVYACTWSLTCDGRFLEFLRGSVGTARPPRALRQMGAQSRKCPQRIERIGPVGTVQIGWVLRAPGTDRPPNRRRQIGVFSPLDSMLPGRLVGRRYRVGWACRCGPVETGTWPRAPEFRRGRPGV